MWETQAQQQASKLHVWMWSFPWGNPLTAWGSSAAGLVKLFYGHDAGFSIAAKILIAGIVLGFKAEQK